MHKISSVNVDTILSREDLVVLLFMDERQKSLAVQLAVSLSDLETAFGLAVVTVSDSTVASKYKVRDKKYHFLRDETSLL